MATKLHNPTSLLYSKFYLFCMSTGRLIAVESNRDLSQRDASEGGDHHAEWPARELSRAEVDEQVINDWMEGGNGGVGVGGAMAGQREPAGKGA